jgi:uncharacterized protein DUF6221
VTAQASWEWLVAQVQADLDGAQTAEAAWPEQVGVAVKATTDSPPFVASADVAEFMAVWSPARVIAECEARLARLQRHRPTYWPATIEGPEEWCCDSEVEPWPCPEVLGDVAVYAGRDGMPEELRG